MEQQRTGTQSQARGALRRVPALEPVSARLRIEVPGSPARVLEVRNGVVSLGDASGPVDAAATFDGEETFQRIIDGKENPVVVALQGRVRLEGNIECATRVFLALNASAMTAAKSSEVRS
jgi:putative sterol carrier protein